jgi:hypothetical protein
MISLQFRSVPHRAKAPAAAAAAAAGRENGKRRAATPYGDSPCVGPAYGIEERSPRRVEREVDSSGQSRRQHVDRGDGNESRPLVTASRQAAKSVTKKRDRPTTAAVRRVVRSCRGALDCSGVAMPIMPPWRGGYRADDVVGVAVTVTATRCTASGRVTPVILCDRLRLRVKTRPVHAAS